MRRVTRQAGWLALLCAGLGMIVPVATAAPGTQASKLWSVNEVEPASSVAYRRQMALGDRHAIDAAEIKDSRRSARARRPRAYRAVVELAVAAYEEAAKLRPEAADPHYRAAEVLYEHLLEGPENTPVIRDREAAERAVAHWRAFEERAPLDPRATQILFRRALVHTKMVDDEHLARAIEDYETLLGRSDLASNLADNVAIWLSNLAEIYMMAGRLDDSIAFYERALEYASRPLNAYGLAVALDRDEQGELARQVMRLYAHGDGWAAPLSDSSVFFVPEGERHYYLALGHEARGELAQALRHYQAFVASGAHPRFQPRAQENLRRVRERLGRDGARGARGRGP